MDLDNGMTYTISLYAFSDQSLTLSNVARALSRVIRGLHD